MAARLLQLGEEPRPEGVALGTSQRLHAFQAIAASGRQGAASGGIGVDVQRIRRAVGLGAEPQPDLPETDPRREGLPREQLRRFEALLRRELERAQIERTEALPPARPLNELD